MLPFLLAAWRFGEFVTAKGIETATAVVIFSVLLAVSLVIFWLVSRSDAGGPPLFILLFLVLAAKLVTVFITFRVHLLVDAMTYDAHGASIAHGLAIGLTPVGARPWGSDFIERLVGFLYVFTGQSLYGASILWAWLGLAGMIFYYKAFCTAFPQGNRGLYLLLIFFTPSMLVWTSMVGKDAPMALFVGMATYATFRLHKRAEIGAAALLALGSLGIVFVRPYIVAMFAAALCASFLVRPIRAGAAGPVIRFAILLLLGVMVIVAVRLATQYVNLESLSAEDVSSFVESKEHSTMEGHSAFQSANPLNPVEFVKAIPTVLFAPFPWQAGASVGGLIIALQGLVLLLLTVCRWRSVGAAILGTVRNSHLLFILVYALLIMAFLSVLANYSFLDRERVQLLPFLFMWIAGNAHRRKAGIKAGVVLA